MFYCYGNTELHACVWYNLLYKVYILGDMKCQLKPISVYLTPLVVIISITTETFTVITQIKCVQCDWCEPEQALH